MNEPFFVLNRTGRGAILFLSFLILFGLSNCSKNQWLIKNLPAEIRTTFNQIRFIITKKEKKEFLNLTTDKDRKEFLKNFWKKRDPDPDTAENEFKEEYFSRINRADHLFGHEGKAGWDTDRGRVYILLGPPDFREPYPTGYSMYDNPSEVWFYGNFPVVFVDRNRSGSLDLTSLGARHFALLLKGSQILKPVVKNEKGFYNFKLKVKKISGNDIRLFLVLNNKDIYFKSDSDVFYSDIYITLSFNRKESGESWKIRRKRRLTIHRDDTGKLRETSEIDIPLNLQRGTYRFSVTIENRENNINVSRKIKIKI